MSYEPNATGFKVERWFFNDSKAPVFEVTWEPSWTDEDDDEDEQLQSFPTLDEALAFGRSLIAANDRFNQEGL